MVYSYHFGRILQSDTAEHLKCPLLKGSGAGMDGCSPMRLAKNVWHSMKAEQCRSGQSE